MWTGVGVMRDKELKVEDGEASHTLGGEGEFRAFSWKKQNRVRDDMGEESFHQQTGRRKLSYQRKMMHHQDDRARLDSALDLFYGAIERVSSQRGCLKVDEVEALIHCALRQDGGWQLRLAKFILQCWFYNSLMPQFFLIFYRLM
jgi:hypothetical protein